MVSGPRGVPDSHMTASSYYEDSLYADSPERARLNLEEERVQRDDGNYAILGGGWMAGDKTKNQWLQVRFTGVDEIQWLQVRFGGSGKIRWLQVRFGGSGKIR